MKLFRYNELKRLPSRKRPPLAPSRNVRSLFVSDIHLGSKHSQAGAFLELLHLFEPEFVYIVGDFIDGWKLQRRWRWPAAYDRVFERLLALKQLGSRLHYVPGNHDGFLRGFLSDFGIVDLQESFVHEAADGRRFLVLHGDQFDRVEQDIQWLSKFGTHFYDLLLSTNYWVNWARGKKYNRYAFCGMMKRRVKGIVRRVSKYENQLVEAASAEACDGVICGHSHSPRILELDELLYCNTGDWVENCTALVEYDDGTMEILRYDGKSLGILEPAPRSPFDDFPLAGSEIPGEACGAGEELLVP